MVIYLDILSNLLSVALYRKKSVLIIFKATDSCIRFQLSRIVYWIRNFKTLKALFNINSHFMGAYRCKIVTTNVTNTFSSDRLLIGFCRFRNLTLSTDSPFYNVIEARRSIWKFLLPSKSLIELRLSKLNVTCRRNAIQMSKLSLFITYTGCWHFIGAICAKSNILIKKITIF